MEAPLHYTKARKTAGWLLAVVATLCAGLTCVAAIMPYANFTSYYYYGGPKPGIPLGISIPVFLAGILSVLLVRRWMMRNKVFVWVVSLVLLNAALLYLAAMIYFALFGSDSQLEVIRL